MPLTQPIFAPRAKDKISEIELYVACWYLVPVAYSFEGSVIAQGDIEFVPNYVQNDSFIQRDVLMNIEGTERSGRNIAVAEKRLTEALREVFPDVDFGFWMKMETAAYGKPTEFSFDARKAMERAINLAVSDLHKMDQPGTRAADLAPFAPRS
jgi:hypothetical protein